MERRTKIEAVTSKQRPPWPEHNRSLHLTFQCETMAGHYVDMVLHCVWEIYVEHLTFQPDIMHLQAPCVGYTKNECMQLVILKQISTCMVGNLNASTHRNIGQLYGWNVGTSAGI